MISVVRAAVEDGGRVIERMLPKSSSTRRAIELDNYDVEVLRQHRKRQLEERLQAAARRSLARLQAEAPEDNPDADEEVAARDAGL